MRSTNAFRLSVATIAMAGTLATLAEPAVAQADKPQHGGTLNIALVYPTLTPLSWDPTDWVWKSPLDIGLMYEQLFVADLSKAQRNGGKHTFRVDAWLPSDAIRSELAESWEMKEDPLRVEIRLRRGVMFPEKPGVMASRELVAQDVVDTFNRQNKSPKKIPTYFDHIDKVEAVDRNTVVFVFDKYNAEWDFRFGWGYYSAIVPEEVINAGAKDWKNANGTGPYMLTDFVQGNAATYTRNPAYWGEEANGGQSYKLPFADRIVYRYIKDEATYLTALRTAKLDVLEAVRWSAVDELKKSAPALQWLRDLDSRASLLAMRNDQKPFDDVRVRRALNMAVDRQEIVRSFYNGNAEVFAFPMHPAWIGYFEPLEQMPEGVRELFEYNPAKAKALLADAGYPNGFSFKAQVCSCSLDNMELLPLLVGYFEKIGVKAEFQPMEYGAFLSSMTTRTHAAGYLMNSTYGNPTTAMRKNFLSKQTFNASLYSDPEFDGLMEQAFLERDEGKRTQLIRQMTRHVLEHAPYIWLPTPYSFTAWWPWVRNYGGELRAGAERPGPIHARMWIDQAMKAKMGF